MTNPSPVGRLWQDEYLGTLLGAGRARASRKFDKAYIEALINGDAGVEFHFTGYFHDLLAPRLRSLVEDRETVERLVDETLQRTVHMLRLIGGLKYPERLQRTILRICSHVFSEFQAVQGQEPPDEDLSEMGELDEPPPDFVRSVVAGFSARDQKLIRLYYEQGCDEGTIAKELNATAALVEERLEAVKQNLATAFDRQLRKQALIDERKPLIKVKLSASSSADQSSRIAAIESKLDELETAEADEFDQEYAGSPMGRIEATLQRLESALEAKVRERLNPS